MGPRLQQAFELMKPGVRYSHQEIAAALDVDDKNACQIMIRLHEAGHVDRHGTRRYYRYSIKGSVRTANAFHASNLGQIVGRLLA